RKSQPDSESDGEYHRRGRRRRWTWRADCVYTALVPAAERDHNRNGDWDGDWNRDRHGYRDRHGWRSERQPDRARQHWQTQLQRFFHDFAKRNVAGCNDRQLHQGSPVASNTRLRRPESDSQNRPEVSLRDRQLSAWNRNRGREPAG